MRQRAALRGAAKARPPDRRGTPSLLARLKKIPRPVATALLVCIAGFPVYWMFTTAATPTGELFNDSPNMWPTWHRFDDIFAVVFNNEVPIARWLRNSAFIALGTTVLSLAMAVTVAYALSRYRFYGKGPVGFSLFVTQMMPEALLAVPLYSMFIGWGLINELHGLVLANAAFAMPVAVWILKGAIDAVPIEIEEAARVDGCPRYAVLWHVTLPLVVPSLAASAVITFLEGWNEFLFARIFIFDAEKWPASRGVSSFIGEFITPLDAVFSAALIFTVPAIVFFLLVQRRIISGLTAGSVKG